MNTIHTRNSWCLLLLLLVVTAAAVAAIGRVSDAVRHPCFG